MLQTFVYVDVSHNNKIYYVLNVPVTLQNFLPNITVFISLVYSINSRDSIVYEFWVLSETVKYFSIALEVYCKTVLYE